MKTKLVLWGSNEKEEKILLALELLAEKNKVIIYVFPEAVATEEFAQELLGEWRNGKETTFPEGYTTQERELSVTESILPEELKVERGDIVQRAQTEWHFVVLSSKLNEVYQRELSELKERIDKLKSYDSESWDALKNFWGKVQEQVRDRNLFRDHANTLRDNTNALFSKLKEMRATLDEEFQAVSGKHFQNFMTALEDVETRIKEDLKLQSIFEELKKMQRAFRDTKLTREHRTKIWERLDSAFKTVKEKRFGSSAESDNSPSERLQRRYKGLIAAIDKMNRSIQRDQDDLNFQNRKVASSDGQLEAQIRQAKIKMIEERIRSKEEKLGEMMQTKEELEKRMEVQKEKDRRRAERDELAQAKEKAKEKIAEEIRKREESAKPPVEEEKKDSLTEAIGTTMGEAIDDVVDTVKAVAEVIGGKIGDAMTELKDKVEDKMEEMTEQPAEEQPAEKESTEEESAADDLKAIEGIGPKLEEVLNNAEIKSFKQLSEKSAEEIKAILTAAGSQFNRHDPTTWPEQARLAAAGEWEKLKAWQDELDGGKVVKAASEEE